MDSDAWAIKSEPFRHTVERLKAYLQLREVPLVDADKEELVRRACFAQELSLPVRQTAAESEQAVKQVSQKVTHGHVFRLWSPKVGGCHTII